MFDTRKFGAFIARKRKNADMTQSDLAEKLNLTRQAISKYETGDSFPDISILIKIAEVFDITLDELINSGNPTIGETKILKNMVNVEEEKPFVSINDVVNLAPLIKPSVLGEISEQFVVKGINVSHIVNLVQYLNDTDMLNLIKSAQYDTLNEELLEKLIPFLDDASKEAIVEKIIEGETDWHLLKTMLPYIENMTRLLESAVVDGALPKEVLDMINKYYIDKYRL